MIWLFLGGGESEIRGLVPFLEKHFDKCLFDRKTPVHRRPAPRPGISPPGYGRTGRSLAAEIKERLGLALSKGDRCDQILVIDDLDCRDEGNQRTFLMAAINSIQGSNDINTFIGFSAPELESWIIADWDHSVARHPDFRNRHNGMRHWLSTEKNIPFDAPESFGNYDTERDCCDQKLSDNIIESTLICEEDHNNPRYSKGMHTPILLQELVPDIVKRKCPLFRQLFLFLVEKSK